MFLKTLCIVQAKYHRSPNVRTVITLQNIEAEDPLIDTEQLRLTVNDPAARIPDLIDMIAGCIVLPQIHLLTGVIDRARSRTRFDKVLDAQRSKQCNSETNTGSTGSVLFVSRNVR